MMLGGVGRIRTLQSPGSYLSVQSVRRFSGTVKKSAGEFVRSAPLFPVDRRRAAFTTLCCSTLAQKHVVGGVGRAAEGAGAVARALQLSALCIDPLYGRDAGEDAAAAPGNYVELEPGDIAWCRARGAGGHFADHGAPVAMLPVWCGIVMAAGLTIDQQCRDRFAECPAWLAVRVSLAFVHLRA